MKHEKPDTKISPKVIERLIMYRRLLLNINGENGGYIFSRDLADLANNTPEQTRRDLMLTGYFGSPQKGYDVKNLTKSIEKTIQSGRQIRVALAGLGNLGKAILSNFKSYHPELVVEAVFDIDASKIASPVMGISSFHVDRMTEVVREKNVRIGILTVPAGAAQETADRMIAAGITGILNFAPVPIKVPEGVFVDGIDITLMLEKIAFFSR
ncbi:MAG: redox-sensing transcriptional repressor Rex [Spirochaetes bacterium]|nr:redox-sensing transcriptional repressor Rex [Spirochaetota bacterium]